MRPKLSLIDKPCKEAVEILKECFDLIDYIVDGENIQDLFGVWVALTQVSTGSTVFCPCTGIDHIHASNVIYLDDEWKRGEGRNITSTAEHTISLMLQLAKMKRMQLSGKTLGIVGYGRIGSQVVKYAHAFGLRCIVHDKNDVYDYLFGALTNFNHDITTVLKESDIITLHVPLNESTRGMIGKAEFDMMKNGALLINTSRPDIINKYDLCDALFSNKLGGYADDFADYWKFEHESVIQTPHIAGNSREAREATDIYIANKAVEYWRSRTHERL